MGRRKGKRRIRRGPASGGRGGRPGGGWAGVGIFISPHRFDAEGGPLRHFGFLALPGADPRKELAEKLRGAEELQKPRKALLEYCRRDTLGMVRLLEKMGSMSK